MLCTKCGIDLSDDSRFCPGCRQTLSVVSVGGGAAVAPARVLAPEPKSNNANWSVVGIVLLLALFCASCYVREKALSSLPQSQAEQVSQPE